MRLVGGASPSAVKGKIDQLPAVDRSVLISESPVTLRAYPRKHSSSSDLSQALGDIALRERWPIQELHTEEGRLDEVFRSITLSDTATAKTEEVK